MVTHSMYCLLHDILAGLKLVVTTYMIFERNKYPLSFEHNNMTDITHNYIRTCFVHCIYLNTNFNFVCLFVLQFSGSVFAFNKSRKKGGGHYSKRGTNQNKRIGGRKSEADTPSQTVTHLFVFFC